MGAITLLQDHYPASHVTVHKVDPEYSPTHGHPQEIHHWTCHVSHWQRVRNPVCPGLCQGGVGWGGGPFQVPPSQPVLKPVGGLQATLLLSTYHIQGSGISGTVTPDASSPLLSFGVLRILRSDPLWCNRVSRPYLPTYPPLCAGQHGQRALSGR